MSGSLGRCKEGPEHNAKHKRTWLVRAMVWKLVGAVDEPSKQHETGNPRGPQRLLTSLRKLFKFNEEFGTYIEFGLWRKKK